MKIEKYKFFLKMEEKYKNKGEEIEFLFDKDKGVFWVVDKGKHNLNKDVFELVEFNQ